MATSNSSLNYLNSNDIDTHCNSDSETSGEDRTDSLLVTPTVNNTPLGLANTKAMESTRKRRRCEEEWKVNVLKRKRQHGQEYTDRQGKYHAGRTVKTKKDCSGQCRFKCSLLISPEERQIIHNTFWKISRADQQHFYARTTAQRQNDTKRKRIEYSLVASGTTFRVCKEFYLSTLDVSQQRINTYHQNKDAETGTPTPYKTGNNNKKTSDELLEGVRAHIRSFPVIESHYCRADSKAGYLEPSLTIQRMYNLYVAKCTAADEPIVHSKIYSNLFNTEFNLRFHHPKKDRCDRCELHASLQQRVGKDNVSDKDSALITAHLKAKIETREERHKDCGINDDDNDTLVISYDLENVFSLPKAEVSSFFYRRKLNVYNLTAITRSTKRPYCALWPETISGRSGNDIASALITILERVIRDHPNKKRLILWSDSCVPQNRNSNMAAALQQFIEEHQEIEEITQKFCEPGHSSIQDVDALHSSIERHLKPFEIYSPVTLMRHLKNVRGVNGMDIKLLNKNHFFDYQTLAKRGTYTSVKFASAKQISYEKQSLSHVSYKTGFDQEMIKVRVIRTSATRSNDGSSVIGKAKLQTKRNKLSDEKVKDLKAMLMFMPDVDKTYMQTLW